MVVSLIGVGTGLGDVLMQTGIVRCDMIAEAIIAAATEMGGFKIPVVVRLQGTNSEKGLKLVSWALVVTGHADFYRSRNRGSKTWSWSLILKKLRELLWK
jgi:succinyl-CoA synthetase beta subunit